VPRAELAIGGGAILGVLARWLISAAVQQRTLWHAPLATLLINLSGCLLLGVCQALFAELSAVRRELQLFVTVGLLGGFTTFSTFSVETVQLIQAGRLGAALLYQALSLIGGLGAALLGQWLARAAWRRRE
jgi:CrcB protein